MATGIAVSRPISIRQYASQSETVDVRVDDSLEYQIERHKSEIKRIKQEAKAGVLRHKLLIKQAKLKARIDSL